MNDMLREPLSADQLHLLQVIFEPFDKDRGSPIWQYVDLTLDKNYGIDAADVLASLPRVGQHGPTSMSYGLTWRGDSHMAPQPDTHVALTVAGLRYLRPATDPVLESFLVMVRHMVDAQRNLVPSVREVVDATVASGAIAEQLTTSIIAGTPRPNVDAMTRKMRWMLGHEPFLYNVVNQPKHDIEDWSARVPPILRAYRGVASIDDYLDRVIELVAPREPPKVPPSASPLDIPYAVGYLDAVWKSKTGSRLFANPDVASVARLTLPCGDEEDFNSLMSALADVLGQVVTPGRGAPPQRAAFEDVRDFLVPQLDGDAATRVTDAFGTLVHLRHIRVSQQHAEARHRAVEAFRAIGLAFPPPSWDDAWKHILVMARGALDVLREEIHAGLPEP